MSFYKDLERVIIRSVGKCYVFSNLFVDEQHGLAPTLRYARARFDCLGSKEKLRWICVQVLADADSTFALVSFSSSRECCSRVRSLFRYLLRNIPIFDNLVCAKAEKMNLP